MRSDEALKNEVDYQKQQIEKLEIQMSKIDDMYIRLAEKISALGVKAQAIDNHLKDSTLKALMSTGKSYKESLHYWNSPIEKTNTPHPQLFDKH